VLTRLELVGFKSFADRTRFDFAPGITAVVGPNGSGKSNVVDAVRWILGEQSAKSLRGGEMADVIFNGSSSRKSLGMAEVTVAFANPRRLLAVDADEVEVTRRVYRDGTGEYLINGQMSRLRDVKDIFLGSGAGAGGYTIIAQGRVDELLQASTKDRREIFDEAAGISRFKAKKLEALRKLLATEQNLTRSKDRLDSLESQLRTLRMQAAKAQKYREHTGRLRGLRVGLGLREFRELTASLEVEQVALAELRADATGASARVHELEESARALEAEVQRGEDALRHQEARLGEARERIARFEVDLKHDRDKAAEHDADIRRLGRQRAELGYRVRDLDAAVAAAAEEARVTGERVEADQQRADAAKAELEAAATKLDALNREAEANAARQYELVGRAAAARTHEDAARRQIERLQAEYDRKRTEIEQASARRAALETALGGLSQLDADVQARLGAAKARLGDLHADRTRLADSYTRVQQALEALRVRQGDLRGRVEVLEGLERSLEGLGAGVRDVLARLPEPAFAPVAGLVADLLTVPTDVAPLVELALGDAAQRFVVSDRLAVDAVAAAVGDVAGRVGLIPASGWRQPPEPSEHSGGLHPPLSDTLSSFVRCDHPALAGLPEQLLGHVLLADTLADARRLAGLHPACRVITRAGELLDPDGTLTVGPLKAGAGIVSRKSELRDLREQSRVLADEIAAAEVELAELRRQADALDGIGQAVEAEIDLLSGEAGGLQQKIAEQRQQVRHLTEHVELLGAESEQLAEQVRQGEAAWVAAKLDAEDAERAAAELKAAVGRLQDAIREATADRDRRQHADTEARVALTAAAADRDRAAERHNDAVRELRNRRIELENVKATAHGTRGRLTACELAILRASAGLADAFREKEVRERQATVLAAKVAADRAARDAARREADAVRAGWEEKERAAHAREMAAQSLRDRRDATAARIREDYAVELAELAGGGRQPPDETPDGEPQEESGDSRPPLAEIGDVAAAHQDVEDLKRKIARLGSVNMEALEELARVEAEHAALKAQHDDLAAARKSLQEVIDAINNESRKLFTDTLTAVRGFFQELFRKLFGGGQADIVLEDEADVLESGIEITARPPGKELRSLSLLSGGEKTLTAIALLLAIFRNRPSPFCVLDEVDAALDEANTQRFAGVLREFLDQSQFIVVTHKKRTMAAADRLWGVTMQESGVTRLLPMRFEDWPDDPPAEDAA
jgi:chromosome segregation protein